MRTVQEAIYSRLTGDTAASVSLQALLGGSGRIFAGLDWNLIKAPCITFNGITSIPGNLNADLVPTDVEYYVFRIFADNFFQIESRLRVLFDRYVFTETTEAGVLRCMWDSSGPELFDDDLKVRRKDVRYKIFVMPRAVGPV